MIFSHELWYWSKYLQVRAYLGPIRCLMSSYTYCVQPRKCLQLDKIMRIGAETPWLRSCYQNYLGSRHNLLAILTDR